MRIRALEIENFRAIKKVVLNDLKDLVVIAGANGCGKTQIYHAIRLLKSTYGGYQPNEYQQWYSEFNLRTDRPGRDIRRIFGNPNKPLRVRTTIELTPDEIEFLRSNAEDLIRGRIWQTVPGARNLHFGAGPTLAELQRQFGDQVEERTARESQIITDALQTPQLIGEITLQPGGVEYQTDPNPALELLFSTYEPGKLGVFDLHGAHRNYNREQLGGINLNIESSEQKLRQHALYNLQAKYSNVKSELAAGYVRDLIAAQAGTSTTRTKSLMETLQELFATFFPGKQFLGPVPGPDGTLDFPVRLEGGAEHDIDDLSSGEKKVLFGYLRLRNNAPKNSVVLIDEPELHLNPALLAGLTQFYHRHIGRDLGNQLWLMTHSDVLLREAVGQPEFSVYHMQFPETKDSSSNQLQPIKVQKELDRAIVDLVGDLATYRPGAKVVFFEGGGDSDFDVRMTSVLFPEFHKAVNLISAGGRAQVERLHELLRKASESGSLAAQFFSVVDRDTGEVERVADAHQWDRYHIENYLIEPGHILEVLRDLNLTVAGLKSKSDVLERLRECAKATLDGLVRHELEQFANSLLVAAIKTRIPRDSTNIALALRKVLEVSQDSFNKSIETNLTTKLLSSKEKKTRNRYAQDLKNRAWLSSFRGRDILKQFVSVHVKRVNYEVFRDLILRKMQRRGFQPPGMKRVIQKILDA